MKDMEKTTITGQCHCGAVQYPADGPTVRQGMCTCQACQRATGALTSPNVGVDPATFQIVQGAPAQFLSDSNQDCD